ncbi:hypothetical protein, partial [uncultured Desulfovibrio sp.]|uniref:hypothetical protein n=1 Tax=uncultured Desulfovibrio sp. TaxID=167968 RepID=UPI0026F03071
AAGKEAENFRRECTQVLDQENFSLTQPAAERLFLKDNSGIKCAVDHMHTIVFLRVRVHDGTVSGISAGVAR